MHTHQLASVAGLLLLWLHLQQLAQLPWGAEPQSMDCENGLYQVENVTAF